MPDPGVVLSSADELEPPLPDHDDPVDLLDARLPTTDLGNARRLVHHHGDALRYAPQLASWLAWDGARWAEDVTGEVHRRAKAVVDGLYDVARPLPPERRSEVLKHWTRSQAASRLRSMVELASTEPGIPVTVDQLDSDPWEMNVKNGTLDLRTGALRAHDRASLLTRLAPVRYDDAAQAPTWRNFLKEVFDGDDELVGFVKRFAGYSLTGSVGEQILIFAHGSGSNGKSTLLGTLRRLAGDYAMQLDTRMLTASAHEEHPTGIADLRGRRLVTTIETGQNKSLNEGLLKQLTGGDPIRARRMRADYFEFEPTHKLWIAGNHLPRVSGTDHGLWRRIALVPFEVRFAVNDELPVRLATETPGILRWAVEGCLEWQRDGLQVPARVRAATEQYRNREDHVGRFLDECCVVDPAVMATAKDLREVYEAWCNEQGEHPWTAKSVGAELVSRGFDSAKMGHFHATTWIGLGLVANPSRTHAYPFSHSPHAHAYMEGNRNNGTHGYATTDEQGKHSNNPSPQVLALGDFDHLNDEFDDAPPLGDEDLDRHVAEESQS